MKGRMKEAKKERRKEVTYIIFIYLITLFFQKIWAPQKKKKGRKKIKKEEGRNKGKKERNKIRRKKGRRKERKKKRRK